jgi:hypothetical protein
VTQNEGPELPPKRKRGRPPGPKKAGSEPEQVLFVRAPIELVQRVDGYLDRLKQRNPTFRLHRSDVVRTLIERAIAIEENEARIEAHGVARPDAHHRRGARDLSVAEEIVLEAIRVSATDSTARARLVDVFARCRGISRREYEESIRSLERAGLIGTEALPEGGTLSDAERAAALIDHRGHIAVVFVRAPASDGADCRRTRDGDSSETG